MIKEEDRDKMSLDSNKKKLLFFLEITSTRKQITSIMEGKKVSKEENVLVVVRFSLCVCVVFHIS